MAYVSCSKLTASQTVQDAAIAALNATQTAQDAAIAALLASSGVTPAGVVTAVNAMTPAQLAIICAKLNCPPSTAAITAALLTLPNAGTAGFVLHTDGAGNLTWALDDAGGAASSVPAAGVTAGALSAGVTTTPASVVGFDAAALAAVPVAADTVQGKVALNLGTAAGDATNATDALTATGLAAILNGTAPNTTPNALQAAAVNNPSQYATLATALAPTGAPTAADPATEITNSNGEVFRWNGTSWYLSGNGFKLPGGTVIEVGTGTITHTAATRTFPRAGTVTLMTRVIISSVLGGVGPFPAPFVSYQVYLNGAPVAGHWTNNFNNVGATPATENNQNYIAVQFDVAAGDIITFESTYDTDVGRNFVSRAITYIK